MPLSVRELHAGRFSRQLPEGVAELPVVVDEHGGAFRRRRAQRVVVHEDDQLLAVPCALEDILEHLLSRGGRSAVILGERVPVKPDDPLIGKLRLDLL